MKITDEYEIVEHLKEISPDIYKDNISGGKEIQIHCPFCDDSLRQNAHKHGHLYILNDMDNAVFNCFRCSASGSVFNFLIQTGFDKQNILNILKSKFKINYNLFSNKNLKINNNKDIIKLLNKTEKKFIKNYKNEYYKFLDFLNKRFGNINYKKFLIGPDFYKNNICCNFYNINNNLIMRRMINNKIRYNKVEKDYYYFQKLDVDIKNIVITEGPTDLIMLYLYNNKFNNNTFYICNGGKNYSYLIESLLINYFLLGEYNFHIIFDNDVKNKKKYYYIYRKIINLLNSDCNIICYKPSLSKDVGELPILEKL